MGPHELSTQSRAVLAAIAKGYSYEQILAGDGTLTYHDIFAAAAEALRVVERAYTGKPCNRRLAKIRQVHPRAYEKWSDEENARMIHLFRSGTSVKEIAAALQRQRGAIRRRLAKLNLVKPNVFKKRS